MMHHDALNQEMTAKPARASAPALLGVMVCTGVGAGLGGMALALLLHFIQHVAYGYSMAALISSQSFLQGVTTASPARRVLVLLICGGVAGCGWWAVYKYGRPLVSISKAIKASDPRMPVATTMAHALLQIITVALGSPLGREVAPREFGATIAGWLSHRFGLSVEQSRIMVACGAGAGLAAVYNVPLGGAIFTLEVLLGIFSTSTVVPALLTSVIATIVAWIGLGNEAQYTIPTLRISYSLVIWSLLCGPMLGFSAYGFSRLTGTARSLSAHSGRIIPRCLLVFTLIGVAAIPFPALLGNGKGPIQLGIDDSIGIPLAATLLLLKMLAIAGSLWAGAEGGLLTPGMTIGAMLSIILGWLWNIAFPGVPLAAFAIVGAAAFLASSMRMPMTAIVLAMEFTRFGHDYLIPVIFAVLGSSIALRFCISRYDARTPPPGSSPPFSDGQASSASEVSNASIDTPA